MDHGAEHQAAGVGNHRDGLAIRIVGVARRGPILLGRVENSPTDAEIGRDSGCRVLDRETNRKDLLDTVVLPGPRHAESRRGPAATLQDDADVPLANQRLGVRILVVIGDPAAPEWDDAHRRLKRKRPKTRADTTLDDGVTDSLSSIRASTGQTLETSESSGPDSRPPPKPHGSSSGRVQLTVGEERAVPLKERGQVGPLVMRHIHERLLIGAHRASSVIAIST
jgi:hypothetical protein